MNCSTNHSKDFQIEKTVSITDDAVNEIKKPDAYYLVKCRKPEKSVSGENLEDQLNFLDQQWLESFSDCFKRHNGLVDFFLGQ